MAPPPCPERLAAGIPEEGPQLALDEARQLVAAAALARLGEKGLEVLADDALEDAVPGVTRHAGVLAAAAG